MPTELLERIIAADCKCKDSLLMVVVSEGKTQQLVYAPNEDYWPLTEAILDLYRKTKDAETCNERAFYGILEAVCRVSHPSYTLDMPEGRKRNLQEALIAAYGPEIANAEHVADYLTKALDNAERMLADSKQPGA